MYWNSVLERLYEILNMLSLYLFIICFPLSLVGIGERIFDNSKDYKISSKVILVSLFGILIWLLIFLFVPTSFRI